MPWYVKDLQVSINNISIAPSYVNLPICKLQKVHNFVCTVVSIDLFLWPNNIRIFKNKNPDNSYKTLQWPEVVVGWIMTISISMRLGRFYEIKFNTVDASVQAGDTCIKR